MAEDIKTPPKFDGLDFPIWKVKMTVFLQSLRSRVAKTVTKPFCIPTGDEALTFTYHLVNRLPSSTIGGKTLLEVWSEKVAQNYDSLWVFGCLSYYHIKEDKLDPRARKVYS